MEGMIKGGAVRGLGRLSFCSEASRRERMRVECKAERVRLFEQTSALMGEERAGSGLTSSVAAVPYD